MVLIQARPSRKNRYHSTNALNSSATVSLNYDGTTYDFSNGRTVDDEERIDDDGVSNDTWQQDLYRERLTFDNVGAVDVTIRLKRFPIRFPGGVFYLYEFHFTADIVDRHTTAHRIRLRMGSNRRAYALSDFDVGDARWRDPLYVWDRNVVKAHSNNPFENEWSWYEIGIVARAGEPEESLTVHE